ncbi:MAG: serine hydrolase [Ginsengibacter sp.]
MKIKYMLITYLAVLNACAPSKKMPAVISRKPIDTVATKIATVATKINIREETDRAKTDSFLIELLEQYPQYFDSLLKNRKERNVQIIYTEINRDQHNSPKFTDYYFNVDTSKYFYPASTVKLPIALLALQKLHELSNTGITKSTAMITEAAWSGQAGTYNDPQTPDGRPAIESYIKRIFLVSDNEAFNRLYEFLGQQYINEQLHRKGYPDVQILHRLDIFLTEDENRHTNPVKFLDDNNNIVYSQPLMFNKLSYPERHDTLGKAYYSEGKLINTPMNFSKKNRVSLEDLHRILRSVIFPDNVPEKQRFDLTDSDYAFLHHYMSQFPGETMYPSYDSVNYPDAYAKFLLYGSQKEPLPKNLRIFNKVGDAYGQLIDVAYVADFDKNIEFFLSAAVNCDTDGILNDDKYAYDSIGLPFMKNLGEVIYQYELKRKRSYQPDLSSFKITYDK